MVLQGYLSIGSGNVGVSFGTKTLYGGSAGVSLTSPPLQITKKK